MLFIAILIHPRLYICRIFDLGGRTTHCPPCPFLRYCNRNISAWLEILTKLKYSDYSVLRTLHADCRYKSEQILGPLNYIPPVCCVGQTREVEHFVLW